MEVASKDLAFEEAAHYRDQNTTAASVTKATIYYKRQEQYRCDRRRGIGWLGWLDDYPYLFALAELSGIKLFPYHAGGRN